MIELLSTFSIPQILLFIVLAAIAFKKVADFIDWFHDKVKSRDKRTIAKEQEQQQQKERFEKVEADVVELKQINTETIEAIRQMNDKIDILMHSDKDAIKAWITREHHYFCYDKGWIDDYSLDCLERRYSHYVEEKGNSFISTLMDDLRELPKKEPTDDTN